MALFEVTKDKATTEEKCSIYTKKTDIPQYKITGACPTLYDLVDTSTTAKLIAEINASSVSQEEKDFLVRAACRHYKFNYRNIAEYYAHASKEMQELMEHSALVIIDFNDAIKLGYAKLSNEIKKMALAGEAKDE